MRKESILMPETAGAQARLVFFQEDNDRADSECLLCLRLGSKSFINTGFSLTKPNEMDIIIIISPIE